MHKSRLCSTLKLVAIEFLANVISQKHEYFANLEADMFLYMEMRLETHSAVGMKSKIKYGH